ncbi:MAG TPA: hypothetical protein VKX45_01095 [Bryobacteraceae bacterium]|nr:hypothetical protein [Bryobacteraceae bacterium]
MSGCGNSETQRFQAFLPDDSAGMGRMSHSHTFHRLRAFGDSEYSEDVFDLVAKVGLDAFGFALNNCFNALCRKL